MKFRTRVGLLSGQVFSPFGEHWLAESHGGGGGLTSGMNGSGGSTALEQVAWTFGIAGGGVS